MKNFEFKLLSGTFSDTLLSSLMTAFQSMSNDISSISIIHNLQYNTSLNQLPWAYIVEFAMNNEDSMLQHRDAIDLKLDELSYQYFQKKKQLLRSAESNLFISSEEVAERFTQNSMNYYKIQPSDVALSIAKYTNS